MSRPAAPQANTEALRRGQSSDPARIVPVLLGALALALWPLAAGSYGIDFVTKIMIYAIFALSLELLVGTTGLVSFGHAALFGLAGYAAVQLSPPDAAASLFWLLPASMARGRALYALFMGALSLRTRGVYFIMVTLAFAQMAYYVFHDTTLGGGTDGIYLDAASRWPRSAGRAARPGRARCTLYYFVLGALVGGLRRCWRCCCARASATRWPASASTSSACAPPASRPTPTSWRPSCSPARWPGWPASCSR